MIHIFDIDNAVKYGVEEAIILHNIIFWIAKNKANGDNQKDGKTWTYNSARAFSDLFPYWNERKIARLLDSLIEQGAIVKGNYNENPYNRTLWYALVDEGMAKISKMDSRNLSNGDSKSDKSTLSKNCESTFTESVKSKTYIKADSNNTDNKNSTPSIEEREAKFVSAVKESESDQTIANAFIRYWTERNASGKKMRWEMQPTFDVARRLATWRDRSFGGKPKSAIRDVRQDQALIENIVCRRIKEGEPI